MVTITISLDLYHVGWRLGTSDREEHAASTCHLKEELVPIRQTIKCHYLRNHNVWFYALVVFPRNWV